MAIAVQGSVTYSIFTYQCDLIRWTHHTAAVGYSVNGTFYENHQLSKSSSVVNIDCEEAVSNWTNVVYRIDGDSPPTASPSPSPVSSSPSVTPTPTVPANSGVVVILNGTNASTVCNFFNNCIAYVYFD